VQNKSFKQPKIFINSVPKSSTNLVIQLVKGITKLYQGKSYWVNNENDVLSIKEGELVYSHLPYNEKFSSGLQSKSINQIFIYRDLRDVAVSMVYFINDVFFDHPLHQVFKKRITLFEDQLDAVILGVDLIGEENENKWGVKKHYPGIYEETYKIYEWRKDPSVCCIRYEDLVNNLTADTEILKIINFLWEDLRNLNISKSEFLKIMKNNIDTKNSWTYRQGKFGGWREEFTSRNKANFKKVAGDLIIKLGYEKDNNW